MFSKYKYHLLLHLIVVLFGFTGILGKLINLPAEAIVWYRVFIAFIGLGVVMSVMRIHFKLASVKSFAQIGLVGVIVGLHWITFYHSIQLSTASFGVLCLSTTTLHVAWLEPLILKRPFSFMELLLGFVVIFGIYFVSGDFSPQEYRALFFGLSSAFLAAIFTVFNVKLADSVLPLKISFYEMVVAFLFITIMLSLKNDGFAGFFNLVLSDILWLLFLGLVCTSFAFWAVIEIIKRLGAFTASLSINLEPVYTIILAIFILKENEVLSFRFYVGASVIIFVVIINAFIGSISKNRIYDNKGAD
jgi:drug/metabolite transporter (DMT)-like permease